MLLGNLIDTIKNKADAVVLLFGVENTFSSFFCFCLNQALEGSLSKTWSSSGKVWCFFRTQI